MAGQWGIKSETSWAGLPVPVVDQFNEVLSSNLTIDEGFLRRQGIRPRRTRRPGKLGARTVSGQVKMEFPNVNNATYLFHMFGAVSGTTPTFTFTPGAQVGAGKSFVGQTGIADSGGTTRPFTSIGSKFNSWEVSVGVGEYVMLTLDWAAKDIILHRSVADGVTNSTTAITSATAAFTAADVGKPITGTGIPSGAYIASVQSATAATLSAAATATATGVTFTLGVALASASYAATLDPWTFLDASLTIAGSPVQSCRAASLKCNKGMKADRFHLGSRYINEQLEVDQWDFTGSMTADFDNMDMIRHAASAAQLALVFSITNGTDSLTFTANIQTIGDVPSLTGNGLEEQTFNFECGHAGTDAQTISCVLVTADATAA